MTDSLLFINEEGWHAITGIIHEFDAVWIHLDHDARLEMMVFMQC